MPVLSPIPGRTRGLGALGACSSGLVVLLLPIFAAVAACAPEPPGGGSPTGGTPMVLPAASASTEPVALAPGERHEWLVELNAGDYLRLTAFQNGVDLTAALQGPAGERLLWVDSPTGTKGFEEVLAVAARGGTHRLEIAGIGRSAGTYRLRVEERRPSGDRDRRRSALVAAFAEAERLRLEGGATRAAEAVPLYRRAVEEARYLGDEPRRLAVALRGLGRVLVAAGDPAQGAKRLREATTALAAAGLSLESARARSDLGNALHRLGEAEDAEAALDAARKAFARLEHPAGEAAALNDLGRLALTVGDLDRGRELFEAAIERRLDAGLEEVHAPLHNLGEIYARIGYTEEALDHFERALALERSRGDRLAEVDTLRWIGWLHAVDFDPAEALAWYRQAEALAREIDDPRRLAQVALGRGSAFLALGRIGAAAADHRLAASLARRTGDLALERLALQALALSELQRGRHAEVRRLVEQARSLDGGPLDPEHEALAELALAEADRRSGALDAALVRLEAAIAGFEERRSQLDGQRSRTLYLSTRRSVYDRLVSVLMALDARKGGGYVEKALLASERSRARGLTDALAEAQAGVRDRAPAELRAREQWLLEEIGDVERRRRAVSPDGVTSSAPRAEAAVEIRGLWLKVDEVRRQMNRRRPAEPPAPLSVPQLVALADRDTQLLVYHLAPERSWLWIVDSAGVVTAVALLDRKTIEATAQRAVEALGASNQRVRALQAEVMTQRLADLVLRPALRYLTAPRLVIVPDGILHAVPFGALPMGESARSGRNEPLLVAHEIAIVPSATVLAHQRLRLAARPPAPGSVAVVADPVYTGDDPRLGGDGIVPVARAGRALTRAIRDLDLRPLERLPHTTEEAQAILDLAPRPAPSFAALGFDASRALVERRALSGYRVIHFACHGLVHPTHSELSGLVLSLVGPDGRPRDGFLRSHELRDLDLDADLVVLSACRTGRGRQLPGEGMIALPRDLFYGGARSVVASYWDVDDEATAELMTHFYRALWRDGLEPAAALRRASLTLRADPRWRAPAYWAGFTLLGDPVPAAGPTIAGRTVSLSDETTLATSGGEGLAEMPADRR